MLKNSFKNNSENVLKPGPIDYAINQEEESVKLEEIEHLKRENKDSNQSLQKKNIFFDVSSHKDDNEILDFTEDDYDEHSIHSQRNQFTPNNVQKKPILFGRPPNSKLSKKKRKPITFDANESIDDFIDNL
mmetsp:Transcript_28797/g.25487  ORF Transcript_28797/g.25487 Transcript_28797/m.25487 type:complete len:131 (+) Transcript_28797:493-885(+)